MLLIFALLAVPALDLTRATVVCPPGFSAVEKKVMYSGYRTRLETIGPRSKSVARRLARWAATPTASPHGPAPITARSRGSGVTRLR